MNTAKVEVTEAMLRDAYAASDIKQPFEEAMQIDHFRISLRCMAMARAAGKKTETAPAVKDKTRPLDEVVANEKPLPPGRYWWQEED